MLQVPQANREQDAAIPGGMKPSRGSNGSSAVRVHAQELPSMLASSDVATAPTLAAIANCSCKRTKSQVITHYYALGGHSVLSTACPDPSDLLRGVRLGQPTPSRRKTRGHGIGNRRNS